MTELVEASLRDRIQQLDWAAAEIEHAVRALVASMQGDGESNSRDIDNAELLCDAVAEWRTQVAALVGRREGT